MDILPLFRKLSNGDVRYRTTFGYVRQGPITLEDDSSRASFSFLVRTSRAVPRKLPDGTKVAESVVNGSPVMEQKKLSEGTSR
jgi:hypothetical protein